VATNSRRFGVPGSGSETLNLSAPSARRLLACACLAAGLALSGCGSDFQAAVNDKAAQQAIADAARIAASAGEPRTTRQATEDAIGSDLTSLQTKMAANSKAYIVQKQVTDDLNDALSRLKDAAGSDLSPATKAQLEAQTGEIQLRLSQEKLASLQGDIDNLAAQSLEVLSLAGAAIELNAEAKGIGGSSPTASSSDVDAATRSVSDRQTAVSAAQDAVKKIQDQISSSETQARQIYSQTDAAFLAANNQKGKESIDAGNKAMDDRKQAEALMAQAGNMQGDLAKAQADLALAQVQLTQAQQTLQTAQHATEDTAAIVKGTTARAGALTDAAKKILDGGEIGGLQEAGLSKRFADLAKLAGDIDAKLKSAADDADHAAQSFTSAYNDYKAYRDSIAQRIENATLDKSDPVVKFTQDDRLLTLLKWSQTAAQIQAGQVNLAGYQAAKLAAVAASQSAAAGVANAVSPISGKNYQTAASARFTAAAQAAASADGARSPAKSDLDNMKWLGYALEALAYHGQALTETDDAADAKAKTALGEVASRNPQLANSLGWITQ